ncbi:hypothetical protein OHB14_36790 [Streptomyces sp. NBC_01613]|uniref:hypothetical protein n=1 Tax=Streptomyces sp. NBC_01613 TaxID=2975896 RepID=UPI0038669F4E
MAPRVRTVESVEERRHGDTDCWHVVTRAADGHGLTHVFPKVTLEWRAAEYGIDPADVDTLLDVVLHEQLLDEGTAAAIAPDLFEASSTTRARNAHLARLGAHKEKSERIILDGKNKPLDAIRARPGISTDGVRAKRELVDVHRWNRLYGGLPVPVTAALEVPRA